MFGVIIDRFLYVFFQSRCVIFLVKRYGALEFVVSDLRGAYDRLDHGLVIVTVFDSIGLLMRC